MSKQNEKKIFVGLINNTTRDAMTPHTTKSLNLFALKLKVSNKFYDNFVTKSINSAININIIIGERKLFTLYHFKHIYICIFDKKINQSTKGLFKRHSVRSFEFIAGRWQNRA